MSFVLISHCSSTSLAGKVSYEANGPDFDFRVWVEDCAYEAHLLEQHGIGGLIQVKASVRLSACTFAMITIPQLTAQALGSFLATETRGRFGSSSRFIMSIAPSCLHWIVSTPTRISTPRIARAIEYTRVPYKVPSSDDDLNEEEGFLLRAADLIGQLGDPNYMRKSNALFYEFEEIGLNKTLGYETPADIVYKFPQFYWTIVAPQIQTAIRYLNVTSRGRQWIANLYGNVFRAERELNLSGPQK
jgi:hypothetical protein